jgi:hypothetical protein
MGGADLANDLGYVQVCPGVNVVVSPSAKRLDQYSNSAPSGIESSPTVAIKSKKAGVVVGVREAVGAYF